VAPDLPPAELNAAVYSRAATYFVHEAMAKPILAMNQWDVSRLAPILATGLESLEQQQVSTEVLRAKMIEASRLIPHEWIAEGAVIGSPPAVAARLREYRAAGADEILMHGATADRLEAVVDAYSRLK
jgi:alkanesulfonate monooxygenase SsuD/methylene tetrahydromethanopterin reductase-like flavin-dependent oxidoreductase (luciferase family)